MRTKRHGSAAAPTGAPESAGKNDETLLFTIDLVFESLDQVLALARSARRGPEPVRAAQLIAGAVDDLRPELRKLQSAARRSLSP